MYHLRRVLSQLDRGMLPRRSLVARMGDDTHTLVTSEPPRLLTDASVRLNTVKPQWSDDLPSKRRNFSRDPRLCWRFCACVSRNLLRRPDAAGPVRAKAAADAMGLAENFGTHEVEARGKPYGRSASRARACTFPTWRSELVGMVNPAFFTPSKCCVHGACVAHPAQTNEYLVWSTFRIVFVNLACGNRRVFANLRRFFQQRPSPFPASSTASSTNAGS